jgi:hypothetical protein
MRALHWAGLPSRAGIPVDPGETPVARFVSWSCFVEGVVVVDCDATWTATAHPGQGRVNIGKYTS